MTIQRVARLTGRRLALTGDAAHTFPPIGAQGLNLGLRDVAELIATLVGARAGALDLGGDATLARYAAARRPDIAMRTTGIAALNGALLSPLFPVDAARGFGLAALAAAPPLRRAAMREGTQSFSGALTAFALSPRESFRKVATSRKCSRAGWAG